MDPTTKLTTEQAAQLAQLSLRQRASAADLNRIALDIQLRQWCVEQANVFCEHNFEGNDDKGWTPYPVESVAKGIYDFVTSPLNEKAAP